VCTRLQRSKNIKSCLASRWKSNTDDKTLLLLKWSLHSIIHCKCKTHGRDICSKVCGCYMVRLTLSKNSNSASLTILLYLDCLHSLSHDGDNNNASVIMELWFCFVIMPEWCIKSNIFSFFLICCNKVRRGSPKRWATLSNTAYSMSKRWAASCQPMGKAPIPWARGDPACGHVVTGALAHCR